MDFSKMRHRITFMKPTKITKNSMSEQVQVYTEYKTVWAFVAPRTGREYDEAQKIRAETTYNVLTRYFPNITTDMRISFRDRILKIESVLKAKEVQEAFGCAEPIDVVEAIFKPGEIPQIAIECMKLAGYMGGVEAVKN